MAMSLTTHSLIMNCYEISYNLQLAVYTVYIFQKNLVIESYGATFRIGSKDFIMDIYEI